MGIRLALQGLVFGTWLIDTIQAVVYRCNGLDRGGQERLEQGQIGASPLRSRLLYLAQIDGYLFGILVRSYKHTQSIRVGSAAIYLAVGLTRTSQEHAPGPR